MHETNTFSATPTDYQSFAQTELLAGEEIVARYSDSHATMAGFIQAAGLFGVTVVPLYFANTNPAGIITDDAFERITGRMIDALVSQGPWDGVLLAQHGAAVSERYRDADGEIAARVREAVGHETPVGMVLDMHANLSQQMIDNVTVAVVYRTNPHLDASIRAAECAEIIVRTARGELRPVQALETPPVVINIVKQATAAEPMASVIRDLDDVLARPGILSASVAEGYPYADVDEMGMGFLAVHDGDMSVARDAARWLADRTWRRREDFRGVALTPEQAMARAAASPAKPVVLMDVGDNIGGGSPGDSTVLLATAKEQGVRGLLQTLFDPEAVATCISAGVGSVLDLWVGAKTDKLHGAPIPVRGCVRLISDGRFEDATPTHGGSRVFESGKTTVLETDDGHTLVLTSRLVGNTSVEQMRSLGIRPELMQVIVAKGVISPRPAYEPIAAEMIMVDTPGVTALNLHQFEYSHRRHPLYPFEESAAYG
jgi:microcystin degradation protein MlrC